MIRRAGGTTIQTWRAHRDQGDTHLRFVQKAQLFDARWLTRGGASIAVCRADDDDAGESELIPGSLVLFDVCSCDVFPDFFFLSQ